MFLRMTPYPLLGPLSLLGSPVPQPVHVGSHISRSKNREEARLRMKNTAEKGEHVGAW